METPTPVFDAVRDKWPGRAIAWDLGQRPVPSRSSDISVLDPGTPIVADCEPVFFRYLIREWPDRDAAEETAEAMHQRDLEQAAQPPVIEVTVTTPPDGIPRLELTQLVAEKVAEITGPLPALPRDEQGKQSRRSRVLTATRRARSRHGGEPDPPPPAWPEPGTGWVLPDSEDDTPTDQFPVIPPDEGFELVEVHVP
jgi:hypothetical protein